MAQLAEQLICNQQVIGSSPIIGFYGWIPEWPKGTDCKSAANCFGGSNPPPPTGVWLKEIVQSTYALWCKPFKHLFCRSGGTGRRPGLKIPWVVIPVPVRFRSAAWPETLDFQGFFWCLDIFTPFWITSYLPPKWILTSDLTAGLTADTKYLSSFKIIFWYNIHFFYSWKLKFPCLIVSKVALSKIKVK